MHAAADLHGRLQRPRRWRRLWTWAPNAEPVVEPDEELALGRQAFAEIKSRFRIVKSGPLREQVQRVGRHIAKAAEIEPLHSANRSSEYRGYHFEWEFEVFENDQINAFCLPAGKVGVFTGLLKRLSLTDDQLAAVLSHEVAHALAHHASERLARYHRLEEATDDALVGKMSDEIVSLLVPALRVGGS